MIIHQNTPVSSGQGRGIGFASLGSNYEYCTQSKKRELEQGQARSARSLLLFSLQSVIAELLPNERVKTCLRYIVSGQSHVDGLYSKEKKRAHYNHLMTCGSVWSCPICARKITEQRRAELTGALEGWKQKGSVFMGAFTLQHDRGDSLASLKKDLSEVFRKLSCDREYLKLKDRYEIIGSVSSYEVTWGERSGFHPHKHVLFFSTRKLTNDDIDTIQAVMSDRYIALLKKRGRYGMEERAVKLSVGDDQQVKDYVFKWGLAEELTKAPVKNGRDGNLSPFQLVAEYDRSKDLKYALLFKEYFGVFKGTHQLQYTRGLRKLLGLGAEKSDQELASEKECAGDVLMFSLDREAWRVVVSHNARGALLEVASGGLIEPVVDFLGTLGLFTHRKGLDYVNVEQDETS